MADPGRTAFGRARHCVTAACRDPVALAGLSPPELDLTLRLLRRCRLLGRVAWHLDAAGRLGELPTAAQDALRSALRLAEARARVARWELDRVAWALRDQPQVPLVAMKGCAYLLAGLPNAPGRLFADVDLLVPEDDLRRVEGALAARGWRAAELSRYDERYYRDWTHELPPLRHAEREVEVDVHHNILMRTARLRPDASLLLQQAVPVPGSRYRTPAPADLVLHAMTHLLFGGEMDDALRDLVDVDDLLRHFSSQRAGFWQGFWTRATALDLARPAAYGLHFAHRLLDTPVPAALLAEARAAGPAPPIRALMDRLVPMALFPQHPDRHTRRADLARLLLYIRSHWVRMPPLLLARHLSRKFLVRRLGRGH